MLGDPRPDHVHPPTPDSTPGGTPGDGTARRRSRRWGLRLPLVAAATGLALVAGSSAAPATGGAAVGQTNAVNAANPGAAPAAERRRGPASAKFRLASFNVLGSNHTRGNPRWGSGPQRATITANAIKRRGIDVIGLQEVQTDQLRTLKRKLPRFRIWPGEALGNNGQRLQIAWRTKQFKLLKTGTITTTFSRQRRPIPWVRLQHRPTKRVFTVIDIHNSPGSQEAARDSATRAQVKLVNRLRQRTQRPVYIVGDANERSEWFCKMARGTGAKASAGGAVRGGRCRPPKNAIIDWVMGVGRIDFFRHNHDRGRDIRRASDHALVHTVARINRRRRG